MSPLTAQQLPPCHDLPTKRFCPAPAALSHTPQSALQLLAVLITFNPFGPELCADKFLASLRELEAKLAAGPKVGVGTTRPAWCRRRSAPALCCAALHGLLLLLMLPLPLVC